VRHILIISSIFLFSFTIISCRSSSDDGSKSTDTTPPTVSSSSPSDGDTSVSITSTVSVTFSETMDTSSVTTNTLDTSCFGTFQVSSDGFTSCVQMSSSPTSSNSDKTFTVTPKDSFSYSTIYRIRITTVTKDSSGNSLTSQWTTSSGFQTGNETTPPTVSSISPTDNQSGVSITDNISVTFSEAMDTTSVTTNTSNTSCSGSIQLSSNNFSGCVQMSSSPTSSNSDKTFSVDPSGNLSYSTTYKIRVTTGVKDSAGNTLSSQYETSSGFNTDITSYVSVGLGGSIITSNDGTTWDNRTSGTLLVLIGVTYGNGTFVTVGQSGTILTSPDGTTWDNRTSARSSDLYGVTYGNGTFVTVGKSGTIFTSSDGTSWTERDSGISGSGKFLYGVTYGNGLFVTVGTGTIRTSSDGLYWTERTSGTSEDLRGVLHSQ